MLFDTWMIYLLLYQLHKIAEVPISNFSLLYCFLFHYYCFDVFSIRFLLCQSLRARTEKSLVREQDENANSRIAIRQMLSLMLTDKVQTWYM